MGLEAIAAGFPPETCGCEKRERGVYPSKASEGQTDRKLTGPTTDVILRNMIGRKGMSPRQQGILRTLEEARQNRLDARTVVRRERNESFRYTFSELGKQQQTFVVVSHSYIISCKHHNIIP